MTRVATDITVVVVTWQRRELVLACLESLVHQTIPSRVLVVDNASTDGTREAVTERFPDVDLLTLDRNAGFAGGVAAALERVDTRYVALLNNDATADPRWLEASLDAIVDPTVAAVTAKLLLDRGERGDGAQTGGAQTGGAAEIVNNTGVVLLRSYYGADRGIGEVDGDPFAEPVEVFGFSGGAALLRTMAVRAVGGLPAEWFMYYEDTDLSWRLRLAGWRIVYEPRAVVHHRHAASSDAESSGFAYHNERNRLLMLGREAPAGVAVAATIRFVATTGSLALKRLMRRPVPDAAVFDLRVRVCVIRDSLRRTPDTLRARGRSPRARSRRDVASEWVGVSDRPFQAGT